VSAASPLLFSGALEALLAPQERFEKIRADAVLRAGKKLCDLAYANPYDGTPSVVRDALRDALAEERTLDLQYTPYGGATLTRRAVAEHLSKTHGGRFHFRDIVMTPGAMAALAIAFRCAAAPVARSGPEGPDEVLVVTPCWLDTLLYLENLGIQARTVPVRADHTLDIEAISRALSSRTRAILLSQPANPTARFYSEGELRALAELLRAQQSPPLWISDECHRDVVFSGARFISPALVYDRTCVVYSFGKSLFIQGQRTGYLALSPRVADGRAFASHAERAARAMGFCTPTALMQRAVPRLLELSLDLSHVQTRSRRVARALTDAGYEVAPADGTFFLYVRSPIADDEAFSERLAREGVVVMPSTLFHQRGFFRVSVTGTDAMIDMALPVLARVRQELA
jgi:aspartate aminotransferase